MKLLLGATIALLLGALVMSWNGMKEGVKNTPSEELERLGREIKELKAEQEKLALEKEIRELRANEPAPAPATPSDAELAAIKAERDRMEASLRELEEEKAKAERDAQTYKEEAGLVGQRELEKGDNELRRARLIRDAMLIGRITEYAEDPNLGSFVTFELLAQDTVAVKAGDILAIRRNTGILGQLKVSDVSPEGAIANPLPGFGPIKPERGDELIFPPQF